jgi:hypothetical protein
MTGSARERCATSHRRRPILGIAALLLGTGCAAIQSATAQVSNGPAGSLTAPAAPSAAEAGIIAEVVALRTAFAREVPQHLKLTSQSDVDWVARAKAQIAAATLPIDRPQLVVVVDRNPRVQELRIIVAQPPGKPWYVIGGSKVSTGQSGRFDYYITPVGVFRHTTAILDYRALGTFNENHIRGLGLKGMRVWDFGWQTAQKGWLPAGTEGEIRLLMHATDPDYLEQRLGKRASKGCVRVPATVNRFLDLHGVLDEDYEQAAAEDIRYRALLLPDRQPSILAGDALVIIDSSLTS